MAGMPWEDFAQQDGEAPNTPAITPESTRKDPSQLTPEDLSSNRVLTGGMDASGKPWAKSAEAPPWETFQQPQTEQTPQQTEPEGFLANIKTPWQAISEENVLVHAYKAYQKGTFNKPIGELIQNAGEAVKDFDATQLWDAAKRDPGKFAAELVNAVMADPELLLIPGGLGGRLAGKMATTAGRAGKVLGTAAEVGLVAGATQTPISIAQQLDKQGFVNPQQLAQEIGLTAVGGAALGGILGIGGKIGGAKTSDIAESVKFNLSQGDALPMAVENALKAHDVNGMKARALTDAFEEVGQREGFLPTEASPTFNKEVVQPEILADLGATPEQISDMTPEQSKAFVTEKLPEASLETFSKATAPEVLENPQAVLKDPLFKQRGVLDPEMAKYLALVTGGAAVGGYLSDDKAKGAMLGAALALGGGVAIKAGKSLVDNLSSHISDPVEAIFSKSQEDWQAASKTWDEKVAKAEKEQPTEFHMGGESWFAKRDEAIAKATDDILSAHEAVVGGTGLAAERLSYSIKKLVPDEARRGELIHYIQEGRVPELQGNERAAAEIFQKEMAEAGDYAQKAGVLDDLIDDGSYVTQLWEDGPTAQRYYSSVKGTSKFAEDRLIPSYKAGMAMGLKPKTLDLAEIAQIYGKSIGKTIANKQLLENLKGGKFGDDLPMMAKPADAPLDYVQVNHPQLRDLRVHPELAPSLSHVFYSNNIPAYLAAMTALSSTAKRGLFSFSGFHIKSLLDVGAGLMVGLADPKALTKIPSMYKMIKEGKAGDFADQMMQAGLKIDPHSGMDMDNDVFRKIANATEKALQAIPMVGKLASLPITTLKIVDGANQKFLWEYLHPGMKLAAANSLYERAMLDQSKLLNKNPNAKVKSPGEIQREIATVVNDLYGGVNWRQIAGDVENKFLHNVFTSRVNPEGIRGTRVTLLAPDWTVATARAGYKSIKATLKGIIPGQKLTIAEGMYRRYFIGSSLLYAAIADPLNLHFSGHHFWENEDPTSIDLGDGRKLMGSKHFMEIFHWIQHPGKAAINKMGYLPKEAMSQLSGAEYISPYLDPRTGKITLGPAMENPSIPGRVGHALKGMTPITTQQTSPESTVSGLMGLPISGKSHEEKAQETRQRQREARQNQRENLTKREKERKRHGN